jgi:hypothetical protein
MNMRHRTLLAAIAAAMKTNDVFGAQSIILAELNKRYAGSFAAGGQTTAARVAKFRDAIDDLQRALATALLPTIGKVADKLSAFLADPSVTRTVSELGDTIASLFNDENIRAGGDALRDVFDLVSKVMPAIRAGAEFTGRVIKTAVDAFKSLPPEIQALAVAGLAINKLTGGLVTNIAGGLISAVISSVASPALRPIVWMACSSRASRSSPRAET